MKSGVGKTHIHPKGMKDKAAKFPDKSMGCKGGSVNSEVTRKETAKTPATLGPRNA